MLQSLYIVIDRHFGRYSYTREIVACIRLLYSLLLFVLCNSLSCGNKAFVACLAPPPPSRLLAYTPPIHTLTDETVVAQREVLQLAQLAQLDRNGT